MISQKTFLKNIDKHLLDIKIGSKNFNKSVDCMTYCKKTDRFFVSMYQKIFQLRFVDNQLEVEAEIEGPKSWIYTILVSEDGDTLYTGGMDKEVNVWDTQLQTVLTTYKGFSKKVLDIVASPDNFKVYVCDYKSDIKVIDMLETKIVQNLEGHNDRDQEEYEDNIQCLILSKDGNYLYSGGFDDVIRVWDTNEYKQIKFLKGHDGTVESLVLSKNEKILYSGSGDENIKIWDLDNNKCIKTLEGHQGTVLVLIITEDDDILISADSEGFIRLWDTNRCICIGKLTGHQKQINSLVLRENILFSCSKDQHIFWWNIKDKKCTMKYDTVCELGFNLAIQNKNRIICSGQKDDVGVIQIYDKKQPNEPILLQGHEESVVSLVVSKDGNTLYSGSLDENIKIWSLKDFSCLGTLQGHDNLVKELCLSSDNNTLYSVSYDNTIKIWNLRDNQIIDQIQNWNKDDIECMLLSHNEDTLLTAGYDYCISLWDIKQRKLKGVMKGGHTDGIKTLALSKDDKTLYSAGVDKNIKIWSLEHKKEINELEGHEQDVNCLVLSKDDSILYSGSNDKQIIIWNTSQRVQIGSFWGSTQQIVQIKLSEDEKTLYSISDFGILNSWCTDGLPVIYDRIFYQNVLQTKLDEQKMLFWLKYYKNFHQYMLYTKKNINPLYICIQNQFVESISYVIKNQLVFMIYNQNVCSPLVEAIQSRNKQIIKKIFDYVLQENNIVYLNENDMKFLLQCEHPEVDQFLARLPQTINTYHGGIIYVSNLTSLSKIQIIYSEHTEFHEHNFNKLVKSRSQKQQQQQQIQFSQKVELDITHSNNKIDQDENLSVQKHNKQTKIDTQQNTQEQGGTQYTKFIELPINLQFVEMSDISLLFLAKYKNSNNAQFVTSPFQHLIQHKWLKFRIYYFILAFFYWAFLVLFTIFLFEPNFVILIINFLLLFQQFVYETISYFVDRENYLAEKQNWFSILTIVHSTYTLLFVYFSDTFNPIFLAYIKLFSITFVYIRGLLFMKVFSALRHLINMIIGVTNSIYSTLLIFVYAVVAIAILMSHSYTNFPFKISMQNSFSSIFGNFPEDEDGSFDQTIWIVIVFSGVLITTVLANFLIAIMSSKYTELELQQVVISLREQADIILQMEKLKKVFLQASSKSANNDNKIKKKSYLMMAVPMQEHVRDKAVEKIVKKLNKKKKLKEQQDNIKKIPLLQISIQNLQKQFEIEKKENELIQDHLNNRVDIIDKKMDQILDILKNINK